MGQIGNRLVLIIVVLGAAVPLAAATLGHLGSFGPAAARHRAHAQLVLADWLLTHFEEHVSWEEVGQRLQQDNGMAINAWRGRFTIVDTAGRVAIAGAGYIPGDRLSPTELAATSPLFLDGLQAGRLLIAETPPPAITAAWRLWLGPSIAVVITLGLATYWVRRQLVVFVFGTLLQPPAGQ